MKTYITPTAEVISFVTDAHTMLTVSNEVSSKPQLSNSRNDDFCSDWDEEEM